MQIKWWTLGWDKSICHLSFGSAGLYTFINGVLFSLILPHRATFYFFALLWWLLFGFSICTPNAENYLSFCQPLLTLLNLCTESLRLPHLFLLTCSWESRPVLLQSNVGAAWLRKLTSTCFMTCSLPVCLNIQHWKSQDAKSWPQLIPWIPLCSRLWTFGLSTYQEAEAAELPESMSKEPLWV